MIARAGARAIATSSAAAANALGYADGQQLTREQMLGAVAAIAGAVDLPVTADMEAGYGDEPEAAAATARGVVEVGAVGLNMEDLSDGGEDLLPIERFVAKIAAVRAVGDETGIPLVLNARTDVFLGQVGDPGTRLERAVERGRAYLDAGADCIFVPGVDRSGRDHRPRAGHRRAGERPRRSRLAAADRAEGTRRRADQHRLGPVPGRARRSRAGWRRRRTAPARSIR